MNGKEKPVCACKDFVTAGKRLFDFCSIKNTVLDSDSNGTGTELADIIDKQAYVSPVLLREHFWSMFVVDALLGNFDRHAESRLHCCCSSHGSSDQHKHDLRFDRLSNRHHKPPERFLSPIRHRKVSIDHSSFPETCFSALILDFGRKCSGLT